MTAKEMLLKFLRDKDEYHIDIYKDIYRETSCIGYEIHYLENTGKFVITNKDTPDYEEVTRVDSSTDKILAMTRDNNYILKVYKRIRCLN